MKDSSSPVGAVVAAALMVLSLTALGAAPVVASGGDASVSFIHQPAVAQKGKTITSEPANPDGSRIKVKVVDAYGDPIAGIVVTLSIKSGTGASGANLGGGVDAQTDAQGFALFSPKIDSSGLGYQLRASGGGGKATSSPFDIVDVAKSCTGGSCSGSTSSSTLAAQISNPNVNGYLTISLGLEDVDCNNAKNKSYEASTEAVTFDVQGTGQHTQVTMTVDASQVDRPHPHYEVCFSSPESRFHNKWARIIEPGEAGILHTCRGASEKWAGEPCVVSKRKQSDGSVVVKFSVPAGDPRAKL